MRKEIRNEYGVLIGYEEKTYDKYRGWITKIYDMRGCEIGRSDNLETRDSMTGRQMSNSNAPGMLYMLLAKTKGATSTGQTAFGNLVTSGMIILIIVGVVATLIIQYWWILVLLGAGWFGWKIYKGYEAEKLNDSMSAFNFVRNRSLEREPIQTRYGSIVDKRDDVRGVVIDSAKPNSILTTFKYRWKSKDGETYEGSRDCESEEQLRAHVSIKLGGELLEILEPKNRTTTLPIEVKNNSKLSPEDKERAIQELRYPDPLPQDFDGTFERWLDRLEMWGKPTIYYTNLEEGVENQEVVQDRFIKLVSDPSMIRAFGTWNKESLEVDEITFTRNCIGAKGNSYQQKFFIKIDLRPEFKEMLRKDK